MKPRLTFEVYEASEIEVEIHLLQWFPVVQSHAVDKKVVGPALNDIAAKYKGDAGAQARLEEKVKKGSQGAWGPIPMPPNPKVSDADVTALVKWILSLK